MWLRWLEETFSHGKIETKMPMPLRGVHEVGQCRLEPFTANTVRGLPYHDDRFADGLVVDAPSHGLFAFIVGGAAQQPDAVLAMVAGYLSEFVENPPLVLLGCLLERSRIVATSSYFTILQMCPPTWLPPEFSVAF